MKLLSFFNEENDSYYKIYNSIDELKKDFDSFIDELKKESNNKKEEWISTAIYDEVNNPEDYVEDFWIDEKDFVYYLLDNDEVPNLYTKYYTEDEIKKLS